MYGTSRVSLLPIVVTIDTQVVRFSEKIQRISQNCPFKDFNVKGSLNSDSQLPKKYAWFASLKAL